MIISHCYSLHSGPKKEKKSPFENITVTWKSAKKFLMLYFTESKQFFKAVLIVTKNSIFKIENQKLFHFCELKLAKN